MKSAKILALAGAVALVAALGVSSAQAGNGRQYYGGWQHSGQGYAFSTYHYKPYASYPSYCYNYAIYYPATPRYVYYFNPYKGTYWGRFDLQTKGYSLLAEKDRAGQLKDIPEKAFPAESSLPQVPDAKDQLTLAEPPGLPASEQLDAKAAPAGVTATAEKTDDLLTPTPSDDKTPPATPADKPAPVTPASGPAPAGAAAPVGTPAPAGGVAAINSPASPAAGPGVVAPAEAVNPAPAGGAAPAPGGVVPAPGGAVPAPGGAVAPAPGGVGPVVAPVVPGFPSNWNRPFGGCHGHGR